MPAQAGRDLAIFVNTGGSTFMPVAGLRTKTVDLGNQPVDITNSDSMGAWRELLGNVGVKFLNFKGQGIFTDDPSYNATFDAFMNGIMKQYQVVIPGLGTFTGNFLVSDMNFAGQYNQELTGDMTFQSSGFITFQRV